MKHGLTHLITSLSRAILLVGWMGFNGASTFAATDFRFTVVIVNTILAAAFGCLTTMFTMWKVYGKPDPSMTCNGLLAGLVAITAALFASVAWGDRAWRELFAVQVKSTTLVADNADPAIMQKAVAAMEKDELFRTEGLTVTALAEKIGAGKRNHLLNRRVRFCSLSLNLHCLLLNSSDASPNE